ncbi:spexin prohormone 1 isoform X2 [Oryzias melastigma]|uniref:spexin prohormone 1 isoform X2 n=1 Tax=Oryzias melastigma TaxID=30732 RepID=UPI000CF7C0EF|nr:spexin prohormone 1 isoform X2 [Oryzias melastigma]
MSLKVTLLIVTLASQCWSAPQRRNWTPQAILYLKGAQGHRSLLEHSSREERRISRSAHFDQISDGLGSFLPSVVFLELLNRAVDEGGHTLSHNKEQKELKKHRF